METIDTPPGAGVQPPKKQLNVVEEFEDLEEIENTPPPAKPLVTPLTIDPETGRLQEKKGEPKKEPAASVRPRRTPVILPLQAEDETEDEVEAAAAPVAKPAPVAAAKIETALWDRHEEKVQLVAVGDIEINPLQPRRTFDPEDMEELKQSIDQHGILQPLVVLRTSKGFELLAGERRLRAAKSLGWDKVPCVVKTDVTMGQSSLELALIENVQREDLNPVEEAMGYKRLNEEFGLSHEEIGQRVGKSRVNITNALRVLQLPVEIQRGLIENKITVGHARAILMIPDEEKQIRFYQHMLDEGLTVRKAETRARRIQRQMKINDPLRRKTRGRPQLALKYDAVLEEKYGQVVRVKFNETKNRFEVVFHAFSEKEAEELIERLLNLNQTVEYPKDE